MEIYFDLDICNNRLHMCLSVLKVINTALENKDSIIYQETLIEVISLIESEIEENYRRIESMLNLMK